MTINGKAVGASCRIAIVGMACRFPDAASPQHLWEMVLASRQAFRRMPAKRLRLQDYAANRVDEPDSIYPIQAAVLENYAFDRARFRIPADTFAVTDLSHWLALEVAADALADAGYADGVGLPRATTGVIVANTLTGEFSRAAMLRMRWPYVQRQLDRALDDYGLSTGEQARLRQSLEDAYKAPFAPPNEDSLAGGLANVIAGRICNYFNLAGGGYTVDGACASSLLAVTTACSRLVLGEIDTALAGAVDLSLDPFELVGFARNGAFARKDMRPYDAKAEGFWPGEGAGFLVLMREADAKASQRHIYAVIRGYGISSDGEGGLTRPVREGQMLALSRAYDMTGFGADQVTYFEGHGTGTAVGDPIEIEAIAETRRRHGAKTAAALGSIKANIGHTKAAAGMAGLIKAVMALHHQVIPPATAVDEPHPSFSACAGLIEPAKARVWPSTEPLRAGVSAMGFGGINAHVVLERCRAARRAELGDGERRMLASGQDAELFVFAADGQDRLATEIDRLREMAPDLSRAEFGDAAAECAVRVDGTSWRAAVVAGSASQLAERLEQLSGWCQAGATDRLDIPGGVFIGSAGKAPRVSFLFPGQAAPAHLGGGVWRRRFAEVAELYTDADLPQSGDGIDTLIAQPAIVTASLAGLAVLERLGLTAQAAVGHSLGELVALHWAGACDHEALQRIVAARARAMRGYADPGGRMATVAAGPDLAKRLIENLEVSIACYNGAAECVLAGAPAAIERALERAAERAIPAHLLKVSHAFHTPQMASAVAVFAKALERERFSPLVHPVYSTISGARLSADAELASLLTQQLVAPVQFASAMTALARTSDLIIEVGPGHGLTRLAEAALPGAVVALDAGGPSLGGLLNAVAAAFTLGAAILPQRLFDDRFQRPFDLDRSLSFLANPCEDAPAPSRASSEAQEADARDAVARPVAAPDHHAGESDRDAGPAPLEAFRRLIARQTGFPVDTIEPSARLLGDLHLNSINVAGLVTRFADQLGVRGLSAPTEYANATVAEVVEALTELRSLGGGRPAEDEHPAGVSGWVRAFVTDLGVREPPPKICPRPLKWRVIASADYPLKTEVARSFAASDMADVETGIVVCLPPNSGNEHLGLLIEAASEVGNSPQTRRLVLLQHGGGGAAFVRSLALEHAGLQVNLVDLPIDVPEAVEWAAAEVIGAAPGYHEAYYDATGRRRVPVLRPLFEEPADQVMPLGSGDVIVVSGGGRGIGAECAFALAQTTGARLGLIGRSPPDDPSLKDNLERIAKAGVEVCYAQADVTDPDAVRRAVAVIEERFGRVTALLHAAGINRPQLAHDLDLQTVHDTVAVKVDGARNLLAAVQATSLRLFIAFGSIIARIGLPGEAHYGLANEWLERLVDDFATSHPDCRCMTLHWSVWAGTGMGERLGSLETLARKGVIPLTIDQGIAALQQLVRRPPSSTTIVVSSRFGSAPAVELDGVRLPPSRFIERPRVHYPGIELVADSAVSLATDPYLRDHSIDGTAVMPAVFALEAIVQAARALTGVDACPAIEDVKFLRPIVVPLEDKTMIRLAALRLSADQIDVVIRSSADGFQSDHVRCSVHLGGRASDHQTRPRPHDAAPDEWLGLDPTRDLYGTLLFHGGCFRRVGGYRALSATSCTACIAPADGVRWFPARPADDLLLGDPGTRDAAVHALQACIPHRRVLPVAVSRIELGSLRFGGGYIVHGTETGRDGDRFTFDVEIREAHGGLIERWQGLVLQAVDRLPQPGKWPVPLAGPFLERRLDELFPALDIRVGLADGDPDRVAPASDAVLGARFGGVTSWLHRPDGKPEADGCVSASHCGTLTLAVSACSPVGCDIEAVEERPEPVWCDLLGSERFALARLVAKERGEDLTRSATRIWTAVEALKKTGAAAITQAPITLERSEDGWTIFAAGAFNIASRVDAFLRSGGGPFAIAVAAQRAARSMGKTRAPALVPGEHHGRRSKYSYRHIVGLGETSLIGTVYFVNHLEWQGRCREMFLREKAPGVLEDLARGLVLVTTRCSCEYLAELNAFDEVRIDMRLEALTTDRIKLAFEYWRCEDSKEELAAIGRQEIACMTRNDTGLVPSVVPEQLETALRSYTAC